MSCNAFDGELVTISKIPRQPASRLSAIKRTVWELCPTARNSAVPGQGAEDGELGMQAISHRISRKPQRPGPWAVSSGSFLMALDSCVALHLDAFGLKPSALGHETPTPDASMKKSKSLLHCRQPPGCWPGMLPMGLPQAPGLRKGECCFHGQGKGRILAAAATMLQRRGLAA